MGCEGYRAFEAATELELARLTVIFGKNNSGKTTLARLPLFIAASLEATDGYALELGNVRFGSSFRDLTSLAQPHPVLRYWAASAPGVRVENTLKGVTENLEQRIEAVETATPASRASVQAELRNIVHIPGVRPPLTSVYESRKPERFSVEDAPYWLREHPSLVEEVSEWFRLTFGISIEIDETDYAFRVVGPSGAGFVNMASAGRGTQALLPVVTALKAVESQLLSASMVLIEEPEAHLHPSAHAAVAELIADASAFAPVIVESHSENFILRLRRKIATGSLGTSDISLTYVDEHHRVERLAIDSSGAVQLWPNGVFEFDIEEARAIVEARIKSMGS